MTFDKWTPQCSIFDAVMWRRTDASGDSWTIMAVCGDDPNLGIVSPPVIP